MTAVRVSIRGVVQGVGFRPFVYRVAALRSIRGWVLNGDTGVEIHAEAERGEIEAFLGDLRHEAPAAASISAFDVRPAEPQQFTNFQIRHSHHETAPTVRISADLALCADCLSELNDQADRRFEYPYINCTNCGPRYSIVRQLPYDRANTTMADWPLCPACRHEYENSLDRRYHAQPTACPECGPNYQLDQADRSETGTAAIRRAAELLRDGRIVAVKGIGGYHLACDARNAATVAELRTRKFRKEQPFAVMVRDLEHARTVAKLTTVHEELLSSVARPIVLAPAREQLPGVAPDNASLGIMLPYAPLHYLLFKYGAPSPLVLTSANRSGEPIAYRDDDARERLSGIADALFVGQRPIARRVDDSVVAVRRGKPLMMRRSRGYAPATICRLPTTEPILALGADLKNAIALVVDGEVLVSQHIGDLGDYQAQVALEETVRDLLAMYELKPEDLTVVHDLHSQYVSTRLAQSLPARRTIAVQHHQAHIASVMAEHDLLGEPVVGIALDGTGYGLDGTIWGGEFFVGSVRQGFERWGWLRPVLMPGGDAAARFPVQAAAGFLAELGELPDMADAPFQFPKRFDEALAMVAKRMRCFTSSSTGRLFDAVAALVGFTREATFEGQAPMWLEYQARSCSPQEPYPMPELDHRPLFRAILADRLAGRSPAEIGAAFHAALAGAIATAARAMCSQHGITTVALSGGVFQNELLLDSVCDDLAAAPQIRALTNHQVPAGDGGISLGQAALAAACTRSTEG